MKQKQDEKWIQNNEKQIEESPRPKGKLRSLKILAALATTFLLLPFVLFFILHQTGYVDEFVKNRFIQTLDEIGIQLKAEEFSTSIFPLSLYLENVEAINKTNGETLFKFDSADVKLTLATIFSSKTQINVNSTEISGAEIIIKFDAEGKSNFSGLEFTEQEEGRVRINYDSTRFTLKNSLIRLGDQTRRVEGEARDFSFQLQPVKSENSDRKIYDFSFSSSDSHFSYDNKRIESINLEAKGKADEKGAEIEHLKIKSPVITATLTGKIEDWQLFRYSFDATADVDLTKLGNVFLPETMLSGVGVFRGKVTGEGEIYRIEGEISSDSLAVSSFNLKSFELSASVKGRNSVYEASGEMIAEMLNSGEFQLYFPRLTSEVRGEGGNFLKFLVDLQAKTAKSPFGTATNLYISDAIAEYNEQKASATLGAFSAERFLLPESKGSAQSLLARNVKINQIGDKSVIEIPKAEARQFQYKNSGNSTTTLESLTAESTRIDSKGKTTQIKTDALKAKKLLSQDVTLENLTAKRVEANLTQNGSQVTTSANAESLEAEKLISEQAQIKNLKAHAVDLKQIGDETYLNSKLTQIGTLDAYGAQMANLDIAGVRLSIRKQIVTLTSEDIEAGDVLVNKSEFTSQGGKLEDVRFEKPVFVLEPSGRYRASLDISLGGGFIGNFKLGKARASLVATNDQVAVNSITADVMDGKVVGDAVVSFDKRKNSTVKFNFSEVDLSKLAVAQSGRILPLSGKASGTMELSFPETDFKSANGIIEAKIAANASKDENSKIPINGDVKLTAENGVFSINRADLKTEKTKLLASGEFSLRDEISNLNVVISSSDASEIQNLIVLFALSPELEKQIAENRIELAGNFYFDGKVTGKLDNPETYGNVKLDSIMMRGQNLGSLKSEIFVAPDKIEIKNGKLEDNNGGYVAFNVRIPQPTKDNIDVQAFLENYGLSSLLLALPLENYVPENLRKVEAKTSGEIALAGLPNKASGKIVLRSNKGTIAGEPFDSFSSEIILNEAFAKIEKFEIRQGEAFLVGKGTYDGESTELNLNLEGKSFQISRLLAFIPNSENLPAIDGILNFTAQVQGEVLETSTYNVSFSGEGDNVSVNGQTIGSIDFRGITENKLLKSVFAINYENNRQEIFAEVNFADENLPLRVYSNLDNANLTPFLSLYKPSNAENLNLSGTATGKFLIEGNLAEKDAKGNRVFSFDYLSGSLNLSAFSLQINEIPLALAEPLQIRFSKREIIFDNAKFISADSILSISGTKALQDEVANNLSINGKVNLRLLDIVSRNTFFGGVADVSVRLTGSNRNLNLSGTASTENGSLSTFIGSERLDFERIKAKVIFTANQIQIEQATGYLGGGKVTASGGAILKNLRLEGFRLDLVGRNITAPLPKDFITTGNAEITIASRRSSSNSDDFDTLISGNIFARRSIYTKDIDLADVIGTRREASIAESSQDSSFSVPRLELNLIGRDALIVRNNIADLVASVDMKVTGDANNPILIGRITSNEGTLFYRTNKYSITRGTLEFPIQTDREPFITLQAETEIQSYQIAIDLRGELSDLSSMTLNVRSNPPLPQADIVSLITTGSLANTETGIPTIAQSGINTAAEVLTDALVNAPIRRATDRLFGLNRFEISPIISGIRQLPTARLTVGRQINQNLLVTYSTNLSEDQRQVIALEYRISNRLSFIAQYQQKSLNNFVQDRNSFNFEIRLRKRF